MQRFFDGDIDSRAPFRRLAALKCIVKSMGWRHGDGAVWVPPLRPPPSIRHTARWASAEDVSGMV